MQPHSVEPTQASLATLPLSISRDENSTRSACIYHNCRFLVHLTHWNYGSIAGVCPPPRNPCSQLFPPWSGPIVAKQCPSRGRERMTGMDAFVLEFQASGCGEDFNLHFPCSRKFPHGIGGSKRIRVGEGPEPKISHFYVTVIYWPMGHLPALMPKVPQILGRVPDASVPRKVTPRLTPREGVSTPFSVGPSCFKKERKIESCGV